MLKRLWRLLAHQQRHEFYEHSTDDSLSMFAEFGAAKWTRAETATEPATGISGLAQNEQLRHDTMDHLMSSLMNTNIGSFEKCEDEQKFLVGMLAMRMLRRIKKTLEGLRSMLRQERQGCKNEEHSRNPLSGLIPSMLDKLDKSVTELDQALKCSIDA